MADRDFLLRLTPDRVLETLDEAAEWVRERGLVTLLPGTSLRRLAEDEVVVGRRTRAALADPLCREELARVEAREYGEHASRLVAHLTEAGPSLVDELMKSWASHASRFAGFESDSRHSAPSSRRACASVSRAEGSGTRASSIVGISSAPHRASTAVCLTSWRMACEQPSSHPIARCSLGSHGRSTRG